MCIWQLSVGIHKDTWKRGYIQSKHGKTFQKTDMYILFSLPRDNSKEPPPRTSLFKCREKMKSRYMGSYTFFSLLLFISFFKFYQLFSNKVSRILVLRMDLVDRQRSHPWSSTNPPQALDDELIEARNPEFSTRSVAGDEDGEIEALALRSVKFEEWTTSRPPNLHVTSLVVPEASPPWSFLWDGADLVVRKSNRPQRCHWVIGQRVWMHNLARVPMIV